MEIYKSLFAALTLTALYTSPVVAGPSVTVTFKNLGTKTATYTPITNNEFITKTNASSTPEASIIPNSTDSYRIQNNSVFTHANLRYQSGSKTCVFLSTFVTAPGPGATKIPKWNNAATPGGGAICTIKTTRTNPSTYAWSIEITMK